jgi:hypothetical protein
MANDEQFSPFQRYRLKTTAVPETRPIPSFSLFLFVLLWRFLFRLSSATDVHRNAVEVFMLIGV